MQNNSTFKSKIENYLIDVNRALLSLDIESITNLAQFIYHLPSSASVLTVGNGGSATTASHMAVDFGVGSLRRGKYLRAISLCDNSGVLLATANDLDFEKVFSEQIKLLGKPGDLLILISASGQSQNLIHANSIAKDRGLTTVSITGFDGGKLKSETDLNVHVETKIGEYGVVEDVHLMISHMITECIRN